MTKQLSDTQAMILTAAAGRDRFVALPLPASCKGGAAIKVVGAMLKAGLIAESPAERGEPVWGPESDDATTLVATPAGLEAIGIEQPETNSILVSDPAPDTATVSEQTPAAEAPKRSRAKAAGEPVKTREGTKQAQLIAMLRRPEGVTVAEVVTALDWQAHTVRGAFAGALKKKLGLVVTTEQVEGRGRVYRLPPADGEAAETPAPETADA